MKISYLANIRLPTERAHGYQIMKSCEALAAQGVEVRLVVPRRHNRLGDDAFDYYRLPETFAIERIWSPDFFRLEWLLGSKLAFALNRLVFFKRCFWLRLPHDTIIFSRDPELVYLAKLRGHKAFYNAHNFPRHPKLLLWLIKKSSGIVCNSGGTAAEFEKRGFKNTLVLPNAVDLAEFDAVPNDKDTLRQELGLPHGKPIALYAGHLYGWKGTELLLAAAKLKPGMDFVIVGGMPQEIISFQNEIKNKGIENLFLVGHRPRHSIPRFLKAADVLLLPNAGTSTESLRYTSPLKLFEYLAAGRSIVVADLPSLREVVTEKEATFFKPDSAESLAQAIDAALAADKNEATRAVAEKYSWIAYGEKLQSFLKLVIK